MVTAMTDKHHFLRRLHEELKPKRYLEIGVQSGTSFMLAAPGCDAIGVDPAPWGIAYTRMANPAHRIYAMTADQFFSTIEPGPVDLAFIDGLHLIEEVIKDFINAEAHAAPGAVIVLDDVLPRNAIEAGRLPLPGDWTGDVWKAIPLLEQCREDLVLTLVDVNPTGLLVVQGLDPDSDPLDIQAPGWRDTWMREIPPPKWIIQRDPVADDPAPRVYQPTDALERILHQHTQELSNA